MLFTPLLLLLPAAASAVEVCDGVDQDGDGLVDEGPVLASFDGDGDGQGEDETAALYLDCASVPAGAVPDASDCDDGDVTVWSGAVEACDADDDDCDGLFDDGACGGEVDTEDDSAWLAIEAPTAAWAGAVDACALLGWQLGSAPVWSEQEGLARLADNYPGPFWIGLTDPVTEGVYTWSDGSVGAYTNWLLGQPDNGGPYGNEDCVVIESTGFWSDRACELAYGYVCERVCTERIWFDDDDGDGLGDPTDDTDECESPRGHVANGHDCNDDDPNLPAIFYADEDLDGFGDEPIIACAGAAVGGDCADLDPYAYPGAPEIAGDGVDQDCDGLDLPLPEDTGGTAGTDPVDPGGEPIDTGDPGDPTVDPTGGTDPAGDSGTSPGTDTTDPPTDPPSRGADSDGDGVADAVDPDPFDAGGASGEAPTADLGCGCGSTGGAGGPAPGPWLVLAGLVVGARFRRSPPLAP